jgi:hypothetical protein
MAVMPLPVLRQKLGIMGRTLKRRNADGSVMHPQAQRSLGPEKPLKTFLHPFLREPLQTITLVYRHDPSQSSTAFMLDAHSTISSRRSLCFCAASNVVIPGRRWIARPQVRPSILEGLDGTPPPSSSSGRALMN